MFRRKTSRRGIMLASSFVFEFEDRGNGCKIVAVSSSTRYMSVIISQRASNWAHTVAAASLRDGRRSSVLAGLLPRQVAELHVVALIITFDAFIFKVS